MTYMANWNPLPTKVVLTRLRFSTTVRKYFVHNKEEEPWLSVIPLPKHHVLNCRKNSVVLFVHFL